MRTKKRRGSSDPAAPAPWTEKRPCHPDEVSSMGGKDSDSSNKQRRSKCIQNERSPHTMTNKKSGKDSEESHGESEETQFNPWLGKILIESLQGTPDTIKAAVCLLMKSDLHKKEHIKGLQEFMNSNGCEYLIQAMRKVTEDAFQEQCCKLIADLLFSKHQEVVKRFQTCGATLAVANSVMKAQDPTNERLMFHACSALVNLASQKIYEREFIEAGGIEAVVRAMNNCPNHARLQKSACFCISNVANQSSEETRKYIFDSGAAISISTAKFNFKDTHEDADKAAHRALNSLLGHDNEQVSVVILRDPNTLSDANES